MSGYAGTSPAHYAEVLAGLDGGDRATLADLVRGVLDRLEVATGHSMGT
ncbi:MAG: hypothetical protein JWN29_1502, partial [Acidimicrobiales bacterium]|nr:hypothetical protein [Acidimicrobiales bacterium]